ncbi:MAG: metallophosphoesterase [Chloroflexi bacterium]|nr:metallophosphoesterase [Chloroflexota bacterium]
MLIRGNLHQIVVAAVLLSLAAGLLPLPGANAASSYQAAVGNPPVSKIIFLPSIQSGVAGGSPAPNPSGDPVLMAAGDIARCGSPGAGETAALIEKVTSAAIAAIGDTAYNQGTPTQFTDCYTPTWGPFKSRTHPAVGNHEYMTSGASGYFGYFGSAAGSPKKGYYSYNLGDWHIIVLNSNCSQVGGCKTDTPQETWLKADLAAHPTQCTLAYWHHPLFSSGEHGNNTYVQPFWQDLYAAGAELALDGHDHDYERFAPMDPNGGLDNAKGIREFVVGTGGANFRPFYSVKPNSQVRIADQYGVLKLTLHPNSYTWQFIDATNGTVIDSGSTACHS